VLVVPLLQSAGLGCRLAVVVKGVVVIMPAEAVVAGCAPLTHSTHPAHPHAGLYESEQEQKLWAHVSTRNSQAAGPAPAGTPAVASAAEPASAADADVVAAAEPEPGTPPQE